VGAPSADSGVNSILGEVVSGGLRARLGAPDDATKGFGASRELPDPGVGLMGEWAYTPAEAPVLLTDSLHGARRDGDGAGVAVFRPKPEQRVK
jgi:hypothetical protein